MQDGARKLMAGAAGQPSVGSSATSEGAEVSRQGNRTTGVPGLEFPRFFTSRPPTSWSPSTSAAHRHAGARVSVKQLIDRVVDTITAGRGRRTTSRRTTTCQAFSDELKHLLVHQKAASTARCGSTCGVEKKPQCSACFINSVKDTHGLDPGPGQDRGHALQVRLGHGHQPVSMRSSEGALAGGGIASGPVSFMKGFDAFAGVIKSGGKTRRAAKMVILNAEHPDIVEFIDCKARRRRRLGADRRGLRRLVHRRGLRSVFFQNANNSVRVTDEFMQAVIRTRGGRPARSPTGDRWTPTRRAI
jgi:hypothetical protein